MKAVVSILFAWTLTTTTAWALGAVLLRRLRLRLHRSEEMLLGFVVGAPVLSALIFAVCALHLLHKGVLLAIAVAAFALLATSRACTPPEHSLTPVSRTWAILFGTGLAAFGFLYFFNALAPETSPDGAGYHIPMAALYYRAHGFVRVTWSMYGNLSEGIELLFLMAFAFGRQSAAAMVHFSFLVALPLLMLTYARRFGFPTAGAAAALFVFVSPVAGIDGSSAYIDVALACIVFAMFFFLQLWSHECDIRLLIPAGLLAGFAFAVKYTAVVAVPYAVGFVIWKALRQKAPVARPTLLTASLAFAMMAPWLAKNWLFVDNPLAPFENSIFPNQYFHISAEQDYRNYLKTYGLSSYKEIPLELTVHGDRLAGIFGPLFVLSPLALLAVRFQAGRHLLLAAAVFSGMYFTNIGARFLIPVVPFLSLALALVLQRLSSLLMVITLIHVVLCWPTVLSMYCAPYAWRLTGAPIGAALRKPPEDIYLSQHWPPYLIDRMLDQQTKPTDRVFSFMAIPESYTSRRILVDSQAAANEVLGDTLFTAFIRDYQPVRLSDFHFQERQLQRIRVVQTRRPASDQWDVAEFRVFDRDLELPRESQWRLRAQPNPWDVQLAFDNAIITRWRSWQTAEPGMFIDVDFGTPRTLDSVRLETREAAETGMRLEGWDLNGNWITLCDQPVVTRRPITMNLRRAATETLMRRGVKYLLIDASNYGADDFFSYPGYWGLKEVGRVGETRLYHIE